MSEEFRNCLQEARQAVSARNSDIVLDPNKFTVVQRTPYYCKVTDAYAGETISIRAVLDTREEAQDYLKQIEYGEWDDAEFEIRPKLPPRVVRPITDDTDVPF